MYQGHTAGGKDLHVNLKMEIAKNFEPHRRLRGAAIAVQTVNYSAKKTDPKSRKPHMTDNQSEAKRVVFSDEVLNSSSPSAKIQNSSSHSLRKLDFCENAWKSIECLTGRNLPQRRVSSPEIHSPIGTDTFGDLKGQGEWVLNAESEESVFSQQVKRGTLTPKHRSINKLDLTCLGPSKTSPTSAFCEEEGNRGRKRPYSARVVSKNGTPIEKFSIPEIKKERETVNLGQFIKRDVVLRPVLTDL